MSKLTNDENKMNLSAQHHTLISKSPKDLVSALLINNIFNSSGSLQGFSQFAIKMCRNVS